MTDLEKFLRQASRGLWGRERQTVRRELESHVRHRANRYEISGSSETEAIKRAIEDLGDARAISAGMRQTYTIPNTIRAGVLLAALTTFVFMGTQLSTAQVTGFPTPACLKLNPSGYSANMQENLKEQDFALSCEPNYLWVATNSFRSALEPLGVKFTELVMGAYEIRFPNGLPFRTGGNEGILVFDFVEILKKTNLPVKIEGWDNPTITVGKTSFALGSSENKISGSSVYATLLYKDLLMY